MSSRSRQRNRRQAQQQKQKKVPLTALYEEFECYSCRKNNRTGQPDVFCVECDDYFCSKCKDMHLLIPRIEKHFFAGQQDYVVGAANNQKFQDACSSHPKLYIDIRCDTHDSIMCNLCAKILHKDCTTEYIPHFVKDKDFSGQLQEAQAELMRVTEDLGRELETRQHIKERLDSRRTHVFDDMTAFKQRIQNMFDELERKTVQEVELRRENAKNALEENERAQEPYYARLEEYQARYEELSGRGVQEGDPEMDELVAKMGHCVQKIDELEAPPPQLDFEVDTEILEMLENARSLGTVGLEHKEEGAVGGAGLDVGFKPDLSLLEALENKLGLGTIRTVNGNVAVAGGDNDDSDQDSDDEEGVSNHIACDGDRTCEENADGGDMQATRTETSACKNASREITAETELESNVDVNACRKINQNKTSDEIDEDSFNE